MVDITLLGQLKRQNELIIQITKERDNALALYQLENMKKPKEKTVIKKVYIERKVYQPKSITYVNKDFKELYTKARKEAERLRSTIKRFQEVTGINIRSAIYNRPKDNEQ
ncbi:hypothetical protein [Klebsiella pneumoniae]|nr:hypothetical protein [Klebsiella pneumoniae]